MRKIKGLIIAIMLVFVLYGCQAETENSTTDAFMGGTRAIDAKFEQMGTFENGVEYVWIDESFPIDVTVNNVGEELIPAQSLEVTIYGVDTEMYGMEFHQNHNTYEIEPKTKFNPLGGEQTITFGLAKLEFFSGNQLPVEFNARIEYPYKTKVAVPNVCFKEDLRDSSLCNPVADRRFSFSGAPIIVTKVTQETSGSNRIGLRFEIENRGGGSAAAEDIAMTERSDSINFQLIEGNEPIGWECNSRGNPEYATLTGGKGTIFCRSDELPVGTLYEKQLTLELSYTYRENIKRKIIIRNEP